MSTIQRWVEEIGSRHLQELRERMEADQVLHQHYMETLLSIAISIYEEGLDDGRRNVEDCETVERRLVRKGLAKKAP